MSTLVSLSCFLSAGVLLGFAYRLERNRRRDLAEPVLPAEPAPPPLTGRTPMPSRPAPSSVSVSFERRDDECRSEKPESGMRGRPSPAERSPAASGFSVAGWPSARQEGSAGRLSGSAEVPSFEGLSGAARRRRGLWQAPAGDAVRPPAEEVFRWSDRQARTGPAVRIDALADRSEPERPRPRRKIVVTIAVEPHARLDQRGKGSGPVRKMTFHNFSAVAIGDHNRVERKTGYHIRKMTFDTEELARKLERGDIRKALIRVVGEPGDRQANKRFRRLLTTAGEPEERLRSRVTFEAAADARTEVIDGDTVAHGNRNTVRTQHRHTIERGRMPLSVLLRDNPHLVESFAHLLRNPADRDNAQRFNREADEALRAIHPDMVLRVADYGDTPTRVDRSEGVVAAHATSRATAVHGRDNKIIDRSSLTVGKTVGPAEEIADRTRKIHGIRRDIGRMDGPFNGPWQ